LISTPSIAVIRSSCFSPALPAGASAVTEVIITLPSLVSLWNPASTLGGSFPVPDFSVSMMAKTVLGLLRDQSNPTRPTFTVGSPLVTLVKVFPPSVER
jgi:hypothetical protein